jgi:SAM-dependent methyltransferase
VLDVGCGRGETTLDLARLVGAKGSVVGIDACESRLVIARREARTVDARNVSFIRGDAEAFPFEESEGFDLFFARFGRTSLRAPEKALRNIRRALKPGGRLLNVAWRAAALNPWVDVASAIALRHLPPPVEAADVRSSGLFSLADPAVARALLESAGYVAVTFEAIDAPVVVGTSVDEAIALQLEVGPAADLLRSAEHAATAARGAIVAELRAALERFVTARGVVMGSSAWCITAANPS